ncbi:hypothetical protein [Sebaldella sp. S0638]|uniref:hypothetical protein n=1 Tax=Sebaldella sp. S0638 TaxID=2957809 RepID=UPI00209EFF84|nr:hypothetical protein [Sebaldella sp. S0638]MCP1224791.1 hypothetical protein [Sebaldella sp. S0638]
MKQIFLAITVIFFISCTILEADTSLNENQMLSDGKEIYNLMGNLNKAITDKNPKKIRDITDLDSKETNVKETTDFALKILASTDYQVLFQMVNTDSFNTSLLKDKVTKIYEVNMEDKANLTSNFLIVNRYSNDNYTLIVVKSKKNKGFNEVSRISFEIKRKGKKFRIAKIGLFSS